jgi:hypothetical protein
VRIWRQGEAHRKFFARSRFETPEACLAAAVAWRDATLADLDAAVGSYERSYEQTEAMRRKISAKLTRTGIRGFGFQIGHKRSGFRLYVTAQWSEESGTVTRMRSLHAHGIDGAVAQVVPFIIEHVPDHEGKDPEAFTNACTAALRQLLRRIYRAGAYPPSRHGHEEERYAALKRFVEQEDRQLVAGN